jgi:uncharacterized protein YjaG (DUF416 family)
MEIKINFNNQNEKTELKTPELDKINLVRVILSS